MKVTREDIADALAPIIGTNVYRAIKFCAPGVRIKATRKGHLDKRQKSIDIVVTVGPPNYAERIIIKKELVITPKDDFYNARPLFVFSERKA